MVKLLEKHQAYDKEFQNEIKNNNERIRELVIETLKK
jgi:hypothetical protein